MNKNFFNGILCGILFLFVATFSSCKDYDEDIEGLDNRVTELESKTKKLQNQLDDAIANGCWIEYYEIDQASGNCTLHFQGRAETLTIPSIEGKDAIIRHFRVTHGVWQYATNDGEYADVLDVSTNKPILVTKDEDGQLVLGNINIQAVETEDAGTAQVIYIGNVQTTIKCDRYDPILAVDEENKYMVVSVGSVHYMLLMEGSSFKGLQSVSYRRTCAFDDYIEAITLVDEQNRKIIACPARVSFRVLPANFKLEQAKFSCADVRELKTRAVTPSLSYVENTAILDDGILSLSLNPENMADGVYFGAVLNIELNGYKTTSDDFVVTKSTRKTSDAKVFILTDGVWKEATETIEFDEENPFYLKEISCGFEVGRNKTPESLEDLGLDLKLSYELSEEAEEYFTVGEDENGDSYLSAINSGEGEVTLVYTLNDGTPVLKKKVNVKATAVNLLLGAASEANLSAISSLHNSAIYVELNSQALADAGVDVSTIFNGATKLKVGYVKNSVVKVLEPEKIYVTSASQDGTQGLFLHVDKRMDLDEITGSTNKKKFYLFILNEAGAKIKVNIDGIMKSVCLKNVNFYYKPYIKVKEGMDQEYYIFDNGEVDNYVTDITSMPKATIKGKAIVGRTVENDNYSFEGIKFSELYDWSPEDYVTFSIEKADQTDFMQSEWGKSFEYSSDNTGFSVRKPCNLRKLNFGNDQKAEKGNDGRTTIQNTDKAMIAKGGNEGLKIRYQVNGKPEVKDNWYFLDPISSPGEQWFRYLYKFNRGADYIYLYEGVGNAGTPIDLLKCLTNTAGLNDTQKSLFESFISNMCYDWYFKEEATGLNTIVSVVAADGTSKIVVSDWAKKRYGDIVVSFVKPDNNTANFNYIEGAEPANFVVTPISDFNNTNMRIRITTDYGTQDALFVLKKR